MPSLAIVPALPDYDGVVTEEIPSEQTSEESDGVPICVPIYDRSEAITSPVPASERMADVVWGRLR